MAGREFVSESIEGRELVPGTQVRIRFGNDELSASAGCNSMAGDYSFDGYALMMTTLSSTDIGCEAPLHEQDEWLFDFLLSRPTAMLTEPRLSLSTDDVTMIMLDRELASPDRPLVGTHWVGSGIGDGVGVTFGPGSSLVTIDFGADGNVEAFTGCQSGSGGFTSGETTIAFTDLVFDGEACADPNMEEMSGQVLFILDGSDVSFEIDEAELTIERAGRTLYFTADE
jgi:heat shock protein HslJ